MSASKNIGSDIRRLLVEGLSNREIQKELLVSGATVSYHAKKIGKSKGIKPKYDWDQVNKFIQNGNTIAETRLKFGMSKASIDKAKKRGVISYKNITELSSEEYSLSIEGINAKSHHRRQMRKKMVREGLEYCCSSCKITEWMGNKITFDVDHIDGNPSNNSPKNLRLLCPNCHSQTSTWRGRNVKRKK